MLGSHRDVGNSRSLFCDRDMSSMQYSAFFKHDPQVTESFPLFCRHLCLCLTSKYETKRPRPAKDATCLCKAWELPWVMMPGAAKLVETFSQPYKSGVETRCAKQGEKMTCHILM